MIIPQKQFAEKCGVTLSELQNYEERKKIVLTSSRKINLSEKLNSEFLAFRLEKLKDKADPQSIDKKLKIAELKKKEVDTRILLIKEEKLRGEVVPTEMVKILFGQHTKNLIIEFENSVDKILTIMSKQAGMSNEDVSRFRGIIKKDINYAVSSTTKVTSAGIKLIISEFSEKRGVGERK